MKNLIPYFIHQQFQQRKMSGGFPAASLFVDLSGFTSLTEILMEQEKDGAEVLSKVLDAIFAPLVTEVVARGGIIPLFAGDAFAALFPHQYNTSPQALEHALATACHIQNLFTTHAGKRKFTTKYGDFLVGARVGLSYGEVQWGIVRRENRHVFYFRGPAMHDCAHAQRLADVGQIVADTNVFPRIQDYVTVVEEIDTDFMWLGDCSLELPVPVLDQFEFERDDLVPFQPNLIIDLPINAEFRTVCPVFLSFEEPADEQLLHAFVAEAFGLSYDYGGKLSQIDFGDHGAVMVFWFGAPVAYENNVERAAEFLSTFRRQRWPIRWRAGFTYGRTWAGIRGAQDRCEYGVVGDVVNLASRLSLRARWGELLTSGPAFRRIKSKYRLKKFGEIQVKGKTEQPAVYRLLDRKEIVETSFYGLEMVGRQEELAQLQAFTEPIFQNRFAGVMTVYGEAGVGKSRLVYELRKRLEDGGGERPVNWFQCQADEILRQSLNPFRYFLLRYFHQSVDYTAQENRDNFEQILDALRDELLVRATTGTPSLLEIADELERSRSFLGALIDLHWEGSVYEQAEPSLRMENTYRAFRTLVQAESLRRPVVLEIDDSNWMDADSFHLIRVLTRSQTLDQYPVAIILSGRYQDDGGLLTLDLDNRVPQHTIDLSALPSSYVQLFASHLLEGQIADDLLTFLIDKTEGNPFFVEQMLLDLRERDMLTRQTDGLWSLRISGTAELPSSVNAVLIARLDRLMTEVRQVVQAAAVLGREFEIRILSQMLRGDKQTPFWVLRAEEERIWQAINGTRYIFRHALMRDAAYEMQLWSRLRELHRLAADAIEMIHSVDGQAITYHPEQVELLAPYYPDLVYHNHHAQNRERERFYARLAGEQAACQSANEQAIAYLSRALELTSLDNRSERYAILLEREKVYHLRGERDAQAKDLRVASVLAVSLDEELPLPTPRRVEVALREAAYFQAVSDYPAAIEAVQMAASLAQQAQDVNCEAAGYLGWGRALWRQGDHQAALHRLSQALELARSAQLRSVEADTLRNIGVIKSQQGFFTAAWQDSEQALEIYDQIEDRQGKSTVLNNLGIISLKLGDYQRSMDYCEQSVQLCRETGNRLGENRALSNQGLLWHYMGEDQQAIEYCQRAFNLSRDIENRAEQSFALHALGHALLNLGRVSEAAIVYQQALELREQLGELFTVVESRAGLARVALAQGGLDLAQRYVELILADVYLHQLAGIYEPMLVRLTCYRVLAAAKDPHAHTVLASAYNLLQDRVAKISDETHKRTFMENVPAHREIIWEWERINGAV